MTPCQPTDALLVFPPIAPESFFVELGLPRLMANLKRAGFSAVQTDLNLVLQREHWIDPEELAWLARDMREHPDIHPLIPVDVCDEPLLVGQFLAGNPAQAMERLVKKNDLDFFQVLMRHYIARRRVVRDDYHIGPVVDQVMAGHEFLASFFQRYLLDDWPGGGPKLLGLSIVTDEQTFPALVLARMAKERWPGCLVVLGGPWASAADVVAGRLLAAFPPLDVIGRFEGDRTIVDLMRVTQGEMSLGEVAGILYRDQTGQVTSTAVARPMDFQQLPPPDFTGMPLNRYRHPILPVQTTRNCRWGTCLFCYHRLSSAVEGFQERDAAQVVDVMAGLKDRTGISLFYLADSCTGQDLLLSIARHVLDRRLDVRWIAMSRTTGRFTQKDTRLLAQAGLAEIYFGLETIDSKLLRFIRKGISPSWLEHDLAFFAEAGIKTMVFVLDFPGQTEQQLRATFQWLIEHRRHVGGFVAQRFQLGRLSPVFAEPHTMGLVIDPKVDEDLKVFDHSYTAAGELPLERFQAVVRQYWREFYQFEKVSEQAQDASANSSVGKTLDFVLPEIPPKAWIYPQEKISSTPTDWLEKALRALIDRQWSFKEWHMAKVSRTRDAMQLTVVAKKFPPLVLRIMPSDDRAPAYRRSRHHLVTVDSPPGRLPPEVREAADFFGAMVDRIDKPDKTDG